ncbi:IS110 family transposase [Streptosporangium roseum]|uniref:IS110 family transposase n=1 Tax=Streptosporangium roseum TaxID=2001 RepID=UPI00333369C5
MPAQGSQELLATLAAAGDEADTRIPVAIETPRGLLVACLRASGRPVFSIAPFSASRYRERHMVSRQKSDRQDVILLATILRADMALHRPLSADTRQAQALTVLARARQGAVWRVHRTGNELRSVLREYYPAFLELFAAQDGGGICREARATLAIAPAPPRRQTHPAADPHRPQA